MNAIAPIEITVTGALRKLIRNSLTDWDVTFTETKIGFRASDITVLPESAKVRAVLVTYFEGLDAAING